MKGTCSILCLTAGWLGVLAGCAQPERPPAAVEQKEWATESGRPGLELLTDHFDLRITATDPVGNLRTTVAIVKLCS